MDLGGMLAGRSILITGASSGIGAHFAKTCARCGARVAIAARRTDRLEALRAALEQAGAAEVLAVALDVSDEASIETCMQTVFNAFGGLDVLVNNAGTARDGLSVDQSVEDFDAVMDVNLRGVWLTAMAAARRWRETGSGGAIINIASILGLRVAPGVVPYAISKAGVVQMTKGLAGELARFNIRVNAIAPGYFDTEINRAFFKTPRAEVMIKRIPMRRIGRLAELDAPFLLLATDAGSYINGAVIPVDGGHLVSAL
ncbi:glucose 1-dehydrogenase [Breoghania sp. L-A4]|uniref:SDR family NAD(P)-dependent oxidoreductase n=1 Tax=Breoghania sp. L-A4 TaxID=2304600 RepID=UPI000E358122|nr:glucose 1-dehydrogenase [Breoghania sp. L-A4]AXS38960.1 SDR family oxidoreductase [Breoghania sp. L-A4]